VIQCPGITVELAGGSWPAHVGVQKAGVGLPDISERIVDLFAAQTAVEVAWTLYLAGPQIEAVAPRVVLRAGQEIDRRVLTPYLERDYGWGATICR